MPAVLFVTAAWQRGGQSPLSCQAAFGAFTRLTEGLTCMYYGLLKLNIYGRFSSLQYLLNLPTSYINSIHEE